VYNSVGSRGPVRTQDIERSSIADGRDIWASVILIIYGGTAQPIFNESLYKSRDNPLVSIVQHALPLTMASFCISNVVVMMHFACPCGRSLIYVKLRYGT